jgi:hypothetical protein
MYTLRQVSIGFFGFLSIAVVGWGCGTTGLSRSVTDKASVYLSQKVNFYGSEGDGGQLGEKSISSENLVNSFLGALSKENHKKFRHDPRLDAVAHLYASAFGSEETVPSRSLVQWAMWKMGVPGSISDTDILWVMNYNPHEVLTVRLRKYAMNFQEKGERYKFGVARLETASGKWAQAAIVVEDMITVDQLPKIVEPGGKWVLRGKIHSEHRGAWLSMQLPQHNRLNLWLNANKNGQFLLELTMPKEPGRYMVELSLDRNPAYNDTAMLVPIYVGVDEPTEPESHVLRPAKNPASFAGWQARVLNKYNSAREEAGLTPLVGDELLTAFAQKQAEKFARDLYKPWSPIGLTLHRQGKTLRNYSGSFVITDNAEDMAQSALDRAGAFLDRSVTSFGLGVAALKDDKRGRVAVVQLVGEWDAPPQEPAGILSSFPPPAISYANGDETSGKSERFEQAEKLAQEIAQKTGARVIYDPALSPLAEYVARQGRVEDYVALWMLSWAGRYGDIKLSRSRIAALDQSVSWFGGEAVHSIKGDEDGKKKRYLLGFSSVFLKDGKEATGAVLVEQELELESLPKKVKASERILLSGRFFGKTHSPRVYVNRKGSEVVSWALDTDPNGHFRMEVPAPEDPGLHLLEIAQLPIGVDEDDFVVYTWNRPVLLVPIYVDSEEPTRLADLPVKWRRPGADPEAWPEQILERYNEERSRLGLPRLVRSPVMDAFLAARLYREQYTYDVPSLFRVGHQAYEEGLAVPVSGGRRSALDWPMYLDFESLVPSRRISLFSPDISSMAFAIDDDGSQLEQVLLAPGVPSAFVVKNKAAAFKKIESVDERRSSGSRLALETLRSKKAELLECYREDLKYYDRLGGKVSFDFVISGNAKVIGVRPTSSTLENASVERCMVDTLMATPVSRHVSPRVLLTSATVILSRGVKKDDKYVGEIRFD